VKNSGETEVLDAMFKKARFLSQIGDFPASYLAYDSIILKKKISVGKKIDAVMEKSRISLFKLDLVSLKSELAEAKELIEKGGDWDRRNRLKVYEALYLVACREIKKAAVLFLECIATFNCAELLSYEHFMFFAVVTNIMSLDRLNLNKKLLANPEVISVTATLPNLKNLMHTIYNCDYSGFFKSMVDINDQITVDRYIGSHATYVFREYRVLAYAQFLEAYRR
jgi:26S proteasome regulatory subunit N7